MTKSEQNACRCVYAVMMKFGIQFQYKGPNDTRPEDCGQDDVIGVGNGEFLAVPNVGDTVCYKYGGDTVARKVVSRHFSYYPELGLCNVNIVVTDISSQEMQARLRE